MALTKHLFLKLLTEGYDINEIINNNLSLIDNPYTETETEVTNKSTNKTHVDSVAQGYSIQHTTGYFSEANSALIGKTYQLNSNVMDFLKNKLNNSEGSKRVKGIINDKGIMTYEQLKRFKHDIENTYTEDWSLVLNFINNILTSDRNSVELEKKHTSNIGMNNRYRGNHNKDSIKPNIDNEKQINL